MNLGPAPHVLPNYTNFTGALGCLMDGNRVARTAWGKDRWACYMPPTQIPADHVNTRTRRYIPEGPLNVQGYFVLFSKVPDGPNEVSSEGQFGRWQPGWVPSTEDLLARDWYSLDVSVTVMSGGGISGSVSGSSLGLTTY